MWLPVPMKELFRVIDISAFIKFYCCVKLFFSDPLHQPRNDSGQENFPHNAEGIGNAYFVYCEICFLLPLVASNRFGGHGMVKCCFLFESLRLGAYAPLCWLFSRNTTKNTQRPLTMLLYGEIQPRARQLCLRPLSISFKGLL